MGLVLLPFFLGALVAGIMSIVHTIVHLIRKEMGINEIGVGIITTGVLFSLAYLMVFISDWSLASAFIMPVVTILLPYAAYYTIIKEKKLDTPKLVLIAKGFLICTVISTILGVLVLLDLVELLHW